MSRHVSSWSRRLEAAAAIRSSRAAARAGVIVGRRLREEAWGAGRGRATCSKLLLHRRSDSILLALCAPPSHTSRSYAHLSDDRGLEGAREAGRALMAGDAKRASSRRTGRYQDTLEWSW